MIIKFRDIIKLGYSWFFRFKSERDHKCYQAIKSRILIDYLKKFIEKKNHILEVGVQRGEMTLFFKELSTSIISMDIDKTFLSLAKKNNPDSEVICCDIIHPPFKQNVFDIVVLNSVIEHIPDEECTLRKINDILKDNGRVYIGFPPWYGIFGGHSSIPFFSFLPLRIRNKLSKYKFVRAYPTYPRRVKDLKKIITYYFAIENQNSLFLPNIFNRYPLYEFDFFITFICRKRQINKISFSKTIPNKANYFKSNIQELSGFWKKINFRFSK